MGQNNIAKFSKAIYKFLGTKNFKGLKIWILL